MAAGQERHPLYYSPHSSLILAVPSHAASVLLPFSLHSMATSKSHVLLQKGEDPFHTRFEDLDGLTAFTVYACHLPPYRDIYPGELTVS
jgi:hypothetical protein